MSPALLYPYQQRWVGDESRFKAGDEFVQSYFEVYNLAIDQSTGRPSVAVEISLLKGSERVFGFQPIQQEFEFDGDRLLVYKTIPFQGLDTGRYSLEFRVTDRIRAARIERRVEFVLQ